VVLEEDRIVRAQMDLCHRTISPSTWQVLELNENSVISRSRGASRQPDSLTRLRNIQWSAARAAGERGFLVHAGAPLALDAFERLRGEDCVGHFQRPPRCRYRPLISGTVCAERARSPFPK